MEMSKQNCRKGLLCISVHGIIMMLRMSLLPESANSAGRSSL